MFCWVIVLAVSDAAFTCPHACTAPPKEGYKYCSAASKWETCPMEKGSVTDMEAFARSEVAYAIEVRRNVSTKPLSSKCLATLKTYYCLGNLPTCESGRHSMELCLSACKTVRTDCGEYFNASTLTGLCERTHQTKDSSCMGLAYAGPNYWSWIIGFSLCFVFSALSSYSFNLQKVSIQEQEELSKTSGMPPPPPHRQWKWLVGLFFLICGSIVDFVAYGLAPQSLLTPLAGMVLVWNIAVAAHFGEKPGRREVMSTVVIVIGTVVAVSFADHYSPSYSYNDIARLYQAPSMVLYVLFTSLVVGCHLYGIRYVQRNKLYELSNVDAQKWMRVECLCFGGCAGTLGGQAILFAKQFIELLKSWGQGEPIWSHFLTYVILVCVPVFLYSNISFMNGGFSHYGALQMIPIYQTYWIIFGTASGLVYFQEYKELDGVSMFFFLFGCCISLAGIALLSGRNPERKATHGEGTTKGAELTPVHSRYSDEENVSDSHSSPRSESNIVFGIRDDDEDDEISLLNQSAPVSA